MISQSQDHFEQSQKQEWTFPDGLTQISLDNLPQSIIDNQQNGANLIIGYVFGQKEKLKKLEGEFRKIPKGLCSAKIQQNEKSYQCFDCAQNNLHHLICSKCFESGFSIGLHKNHRYFATAQMYGCCDCGDQNMILPSGFCQLHSKTVQQNILIDQNILDNLKKALIKCFNTVFTLVQTKSHLVLFKIQNIELYNQINFQMRYLLVSLANFINDFCADKLALLMQISRFLLLPINEQKSHQCKCLSFLQFFQNDQKHNCQLSIIQLLLRQSWFFENDFKVQINRIIFPCFVNKTFKLQLIDFYFEAYNFYLPFIKNQINNNTILAQQIYCQFLGIDLLQKMVFSPYFDQLINYYQQGFSHLNSLNFVQYFNLLQFSLQIFKRIKRQCQFYKQYLFVFKVFQHLIKITGLHNKQGFSFSHHTYKMVVFNIIINSVEQLSTLLTLADVDQTKYKLKEFIIYHLKNSNKQDIKQIDKMDLDIYVMDWYCDFELFIGIVMHHYYKLGGKQCLLQLFESLQPQIISKFISRLMNAYLQAYRISESLEVGFPGQYSPNQIFSIYYNSSFDRIISLLQIIIVSCPKYFLQQLQKFSVQKILLILSNVLIQQSSFVNTCIQISIQNTQSYYSLKINLINILNQRQKISMSDLKNTFTNKLFSSSVTFNKMLQLIANFNKTTQIYTIKQQYKNLKQSVLLRKQRKIFTQLFQKQEKEFELLKCDNLFKKQKQLGLLTICYLATKSLSQLKQFLHLFESMILEVWNLKTNSMKCYVFTKLLLTIYLRSGQIFLPIISKILEQKSQTKIQKILQQSFSQQNKQSQNQVVTKISLPQKINRMKAQIQKMKKQQELFTNNNQQLINEIYQNKKEQNNNNQSICLICSQNQLNQKKPGFICKFKTVSVQNKSFLIYNSCSHHFHEECVQKMNLKNCPFCKLKINLIVQYPSCQVFSMTENKKIKQMNKNMTISFPYSRKKILNMISFRTYFAILDSSYKFIDKDLKQLRVLLLKWLQDEEKDKQYFIAKLEKNQKLFQTNNTWTNKIIMFLKLICFIYLTTSTLSSFQSKSLIQKIVSNAFTQFMADNFLYFSGGNIIKQQLWIEYKRIQQTLKARMNQFCKGVIFAYSVIFEDERCNILRKIENQSTIANDLIKIFPQLFVINKQMFQFFIDTKSQDEIYKNQYESLIPIPKILHCPSNALQFNSQYNDLKCSDCHNFISIIQNMSLMCLQCGYKPCMLQCSQSPHQDWQLRIQEHLKNHNGQSIVINLFNNCVYLFVASQNLTSYYFGMLYEDDEKNNDKFEIMDWTTLKLKQQKLAVINQIMRRRTISQYIEEHQKY